MRDRRASFGRVLHGAMAIAVAWAASPASPGLCANRAVSGEDAVVAELGFKVTIDSRVLDRGMDVVFHLPEDYDTGRERYPVLIMMGSEYRTRFAMFASCIDYMRDGGRIPPMILAGVDLPDGNAVLVPWEKETSNVDRHLRFLTEEVIPYIQKRFRAAPFRILYGASNGGLFSIYALLTDPGAFDAYIASSPMLGWCPGLIEERFANMRERTEAGTRHLVMIHSDDDYPEVVEFVPGFAALLSDEKPKWIHHESVTRSSEGHVPAVDLPMAIKAIFPDYPPPGGLTALDSIMNHFRSLSGRYGFDMAPPASLLFDAGMNNVAVKNLEPAEEIFECLMERYPGDSKGFIGLGIVRRHQDRLDEAYALWRKALELDPDSRLASRLLGRQI